MPESLFSIAAFVASALGLVTAILSAVISIKDRANKKPNKIAPSEANGDNTAVSPRL